MLPIETRCCVTLHSHHSQHPITDDQWHTQPRESLRPNHWNPHLFHSLVKIIFQEQRSSIADDVPTQPCISRKGIRVSLIFQLGDRNSKGKFVLFGIVKYDVKVGGIQQSRCTLVCLF